MDMAIGTLLLTLLFPVAFADGIEWQAMLKPQGGGVRYNGDGTYYGQQDGQNDGGACAFGKTFSNSLVSFELSLPEQHYCKNCEEELNSQQCRPAGRNAPPKHPENEEE